MDEQLYSDSSIKRKINILGKLGTLYFKRFDLM